MGLIADQDHLTITDPAFEAQRQRTWPGMAHFAGTGPKQKTCRECVFWDNCGADPGYYAASGRKRGGIKAALVQEVSDDDERRAGPLRAAQRLVLQTLRAQRHAAVDHVQE